jgi:deoxyribodipyrimidine photo-lyase
MSSDGIGVDTDPAVPSSANPATPAGTRALPTPEAGRWAAEAFVAEHLGHLVDRRGVDLPESSSVYRGGQLAAEAALARFDVAGYEAHVADAYPLTRRSVSALSPWIRHGLLTLSRLWDHVADGPPDDVRTFRGALLWQEFARHRYARRRPEAGVPATRSSSAIQDPAALRSSTGRGWDRRMGCVELPLDELEEDGWVVGPARGWLAAHWLAGEHDDEHDGEEHFFRHLVDGSRAANGLGWQEAVGRPVTRWDIEAHAPGLCASCELVAECPIERPRPAARAPGTASPSSADDRLGPLVDHDPDLAGTIGPRMPITIAKGSGQRPGPATGPDAVWITAESLGDTDPAMAANPDLPAVFVFDEPLLARLRLSSKRLVFLVESLGDLGTRRRVEIHLGDPVDALGGRPMAATFTPVPGWRRRAAALDLVELHPWPWLRVPHAGQLASFDAWRASLP